MSSFSVFKDFNNSPGVNYAVDLSLLNSSLFQIRKRYTVCLF